MKRNWNNLFREERELVVRQLNETYNFSQNYKDAAEAAYNIRTGYENDPDWFGFEVTDLDKFEKELIDFIEI